MVEIAMADKNSKPHDITIKELHEQIRSSNSQIRQRMKLIQQELLDGEGHEFKTEL
jgi:hypothetical protein